MSKNNKVKLKGEEDIKNLRIAGSRLGDIMRKLALEVKPGITTGHLDDLFHAWVIGGGDVPVLLGYQPYGADYPYPASICISINDEIVHGIPSEEVIIKEGDLVKLDACLAHNKLIADHAITVPCGVITKEEEDLIEDTKKARAAGIKAAVIGNYISDISKAIEKSVAGKYGIVKILSGHGVGYKVHEEPYVPNYDDGTKGMKLVPGLVIAIEPMLNLGTDEALICADGYTFVTDDEKKSAHFEHTVLITVNGPEILTA